MNRFNFNPSYFARMEKYKAALSDNEFKAAAKVDDNGVELIMHGIVGDWWEEMDSASVAGFLAQHKDKPVHVRMNSEGGLVFDGIAIYQALVDHPSRVTGTIEALAASAMSIIAMGVDELSMAGNALFMMHRAWGVAVGNQAVMLDVGETLEAIDDALVNTYVARSGLPKDEVVDLLNGKVDGTWLSAQQALDKGFIDRILPLKGEEGKKDTKARATENSGEAERLRRQKMAQAVRIRAQAIAVDN